MKNQLRPQPTECFRIIAKYQLELPKVHSVDAFLSDVPENLLVQLDLPVEAEQVVRIFAFIYYLAFIY